MTPSEVIEEAKEPAEDTKLQPATEETKCEEAAEKPTAEQTVQKRLDEFFKEYYLNNF